MIKKGQKICVSLELEGQDWITELKAYKTCCCFEKIRGQFKEKNVSVTGSCNILVLQM